MASVQFMLLVVVDFFEFRTFIQMIFFFVLKPNIYIYIYMKTLSLVYHMVAFGSQVLTNTRASYVYIFDNVGNLSKDPLDSSLGSKTYGQLTPPPRAFLMFN
jgi:hypothetical protein